MKLAFCLYKYFPYGGLQRDFLRFNQVARSRGHEVVVYCRSWQGPKPEGADIRLLPVRRLTNHASNRAFTVLLQEALRKDPVDAVIGFNKMPGLDVYYAADSCYQCSAREEHSSLYRLGPRYRHFSAFEREVFAPGHDTLVLLISEVERRKYLSCYPDVEERTVMLPPGISRDRCRPQDAGVRRNETRANLGIDQNEHLMLFLGSGFIKKGLDRAIRALASLPVEYRERSRLLVVGQDKPARFRRLAENLGVADRVIFVGGRDDVPELLLAADVMVHPALDEAAGIALLEAMVAGLPVIVTAVCGYAVHIGRAGAGKVLPSPFSQLELNKALHQALADRALRQSWQRAGLAYAASEDLWSMHTTGMDLIEEHVRQKQLVAVG